MLLLYKAPPITYVHTVEVQQGCWRRRRYLEASLQGPITQATFVFLVLRYSMHGTHCKHASFSNAMESNTLASNHTVIYSVSLFSIELCKPLKFL